MVDLFCGSASVGLAVNAPSTVLLDGNSDVIDIHLHARDRQLKALDFGTDYEKFRLDFVKNRKDFNEDKYAEGSLERSNLYYSLIMLGFHGICRGSKFKRCSVPPGGSTSGGVPEVSVPMQEALAKNPEYMKDWVISKFSFTEKQELEDLMPTIQKPFIYIDPPYHEVHAEGKQIGKSRPSHNYYGEPFGWFQQADLAEFAGESKSPVILSNNQTEQIVDLYKEKGLTVYSTFRPNTISCKASTRSKKRLEVFAVNNALLEKEGTGDFLREAFGYPW